MESNAVPTPGVSREPGHSPVARTSLWLTTDPRPEFPTLREDLTVDVAVIGGGIVGVLTAHLLKAEGKRVALLEQGRIGQGTTGLTTAKLTVGQGLIYARLLAAHGLEAAKVFAASNAAALARLAEMTTQSAIFLAAWFGQSVTAWTEYNNEQRDHGAESRDAAYATAAEAEPISTPRTSWR